MRFSILKIATSCLLIVLCAGLFACHKPKEAKVIVTKQEFSIHQVSDYGFEITAKGEIQNTGEVDLKNVVVTGQCPSCGESIVFGTWFISDINKTADEQDIINYLAVGAKAEFSFVGVAMYMSKTKEAPTTLPEKLEINIVSFEPVS
jgi:hypothetical protein